MAASELQNLTDEQVQTRLAKLQAELKALRQETGAETKLTSSKQKGATTMEAAEPSALYKFFTPKRSISFKILLIPGMLLMAMKDNTDTETFLAWVAFVLVIT